MKFLRMMTALTSATALMMGLASVLPTRATADVNLYFRSGVPVSPGLRVVVERPQPEYVMIPNSRVVVVRGVDHDVYRYGGEYWVYDDGYWYNGPRIEGPWRPVRVERVPTSVVYVPAAYRTHWVTVPVQYRVSPNVIRHERREDHRERKAIKHHYKEKHGG